MAFSPRMYLLKSRDFVAPSASVPTVRLDLIHPYNPEDAILITLTAQRGGVTCPRPQSQELAEVTPRSTWYQGQLCRWGSHSQGPMFGGSHQGGLIHHEPLRKGSKKEERTHFLKWSFLGSPVGQVPPWRWESTEQMAPK